MEFEGERLSYAALDFRANQLARHLARLGVGPEVRVGLCVERSLDLCVGILAILKAGGAYVPLDPSYPPERLSFMMRDAKAPVLVPHARLNDAVAMEAEKLVRLRADASEWADLPGTRLDSGVGPDNLAYVLYTSGSTGRPKGVAMPHRPLGNLLAWQRRSFLLPEARVTLQFASPSFDVSFQEMFSTWTTGGTLRLVPAEKRLDARYLLSLLFSGEVERVFLPPVMLQHLADAAILDEGGTGARCEVILAGDKLVITPSIQAFARRFSKFCLQNQYGPTETHIVSSHVILGEPPLGLPPIGRPITNTRFHVLDPSRRPVPPSLPGELFIAGVCLARGYLDRPELTDERFVQDPFSEEPGARMYRTGDFARWTSHGELEFLGRADHQVKIRGFRVELGEIEAALAERPEVREAVVVAREDEPGDRRLVAYVVPGIPSAGSEEDWSQDLRQALRARLPEHMIPAAFVLLDAWPLSPNGKVDRKALPAPTASPEARRAEGAAPRTPTEECVARIWRELLKVPDAGIHDDFFDLGGHSLLIVQVAARVRAALEIDLPLQIFFESTTIAELSARLDNYATVRSMQSGNGSPDGQDILL